MHRAHALYFSEFALGLQDRLRGPERESAMEDLEAEIGNLRTAWRFWVEQGELEQLFNLIDGLWALHEAKGWYWAAIELAKLMVNLEVNASGITYMDVRPQRMPNKIFV